MLSLNLVMNLEASVSKRTNKYTSHSTGARRKMLRFKTNLEIYSSQPKCVKRSRA